MDQLYREHLLDHYKNPHNFGTIENALHKKGENPSCGDEIEVYVKIEDNKIKDFKFTGTGCAISIASTSMLSDIVNDKNTKEVLEMNRESMEDLLGTQVSVARVKCLMLGLKSLQAAINGDNNVSTE